MRKKSFSNKKAATKLSEANRKQKGEEDHEDKPIFKKRQKSTRLIQAEPKQKSTRLI